MIIGVEINIKACHCHSTDLESGIDSILSVLRSIFPLTKYLDPKTAHHANKSDYSLAPIRLIIGGFPSNKATRFLPKREASCPHTERGNSRQGYVWFHSHVVAE